MVWYRTGSVAVTNSNATVIGTGTDFVANVRAGEGFLGPDARVYEIDTIVSATQLTLKTFYFGASASGQGYAILPTQSVLADLATGVSALITSFAAVRDGVGQGLFGDGSAAAPAVRFNADQDTGIFRPASNCIGFANGGAESARFNANGNLGIGTTSPIDRLHINVPVPGSGVITAGIRATAGDYGAGFVGVVDTAVGARAAIQVYAAGVFAAGVTLSEQREFYAVGDGTYSLGTASARWSTVYASTGTINTSDEREKAWRGGLTTAELTAARRIIAELGVFQWNDAIEEKGEEGARLHVGVRAQAVMRIMMEEGLEEEQSLDLDPGLFVPENMRPSLRYAFLCFDTWAAEQGVREIVTVSSILDIDGQPIRTVEYEAYTARAAGNRYGLRVDQLGLFLTAAQQADMAELAATVSNQGAQIAALEAAE